MDEMQLIVPVTVKSKLTENLKKTLLEQINQNIQRVVSDMSKLQFEANGKLSEQAKINMQAVGQLRAQFEAQMAQMKDVKEKLQADKEHLEKLAIGAEIARPPMNRVVTVHVGDDFNSIVGGEILIEDGKVVSFRE